MFFDIVPSNTKKQITVRIRDFSKGLDVFTMENLVPIENCVRCYNFRYDSKGLSDGLGLAPLSFSNGSGIKTMTLSANAGQMLGFWIFHRYDGNGKYVPQMLLYASDKSIYYGSIITLDNVFRQTNVTLESLPIGFNYEKNGEHLFYCCGKEKIAVIHTATTQNFNQAPALNCVLFHNNKLYALIDGEKYKLFLGNNLDPTEWNMESFDGEVIKFDDGRGDLKKIVDFGEHVLVIRDYGITQIIQQEDGSYVFNHVFSSNGKIIPGSVAMCGDELIFMCSDGFYSFNGDGVKKLNIGIEKLINLQSSTTIGAYQYGKYYLACKANFGDNQAVGCESGEYENNALIEYDIQSGDTQIMRGVDVCVMSEVATDYFVKLVLGLRSGGVYEIATNGSVGTTSTTKVWASGYTDFGYAEFHKIIKRIHLNTTKDIKLTINADGVEHSFFVAGDDLPIHLPTNIRARKFNLSIQSDETNNEISNVELEMELC